MERNREFRELVQEEKERLSEDGIFETAFYKELLLAIAGEMTGRTLKRVELIKEAESVYAGRCSDRRVVLNLLNRMTVSFPTIALKSDSLVGILGHECGHWNFSDFKLRKEYLSGILKGEWYLQPPKPESIEEAENLKEINGYLKDKHPAAIALLYETASFIQNMLEDIYVEQKMCERFPGSIRRGILQNRVRRAEWVPSLRTQLEAGYRPEAVLLNLMAQYSLSGTVNNWEKENGELLEILERTKPVIDYAVTAKAAVTRMAAAHRILLIIWKVLARQIQEMEEEPENCQEEQTQENPQESEKPPGQEKSKQEGSSGQKGLQESQPEGSSCQEGSQESQPEDSSNQKESKQDGLSGQAGSKQDSSSQEEQKGEGKAAASANPKSAESSRDKLKQAAMKELEQLRKQLPDFLLERDDEKAAEIVQQKVGSAKMDKALPKEQMIETRNQLMEYIQQTAEDNAEKELEARLVRELSKELSETEFDGDHRKVKKVLRRETCIPEGAVKRYGTYEEQVKGIMRRMKPRLLPVLKSQGSYMEKNLFFGSQINYQALYEPSKRIYRNLEIRKQVNTAAALLVDLSGSMLGERIHQARLCALCLYEFCKAIGIPVLIYGHHTDRKYRSVREETVYLHSFAEFEPDKDDKYRIASMETEGCNRDGAALTFIGEKLAKRPEKMKLLFSICDGFPNATRYQGEKAEKDLLQIKEKLEQKRITLLTAAIGEDKERIRRIYGEGFLDISDIEQLPFILPKQLLMRIRR